MEYERQVAKTIVETRQDTKYAAMKARVMRVLMSSKDGQVSRAHLLKRARISAWELDQVLDTMQQAGELEEMEVEITGHSRSNRGKDHWMRRQAKDDLDEKREDELAEVEETHGEMDDGDSRQR